MRRFAAVIVLLLALTVIITLSQSTRIDITSTGSPLGNCGTNVHSASWFNTSANWGTGAGQIGPGTTVHVCGAITASLIFQGSGTSGHPITLYFEPGGSISQTYCSQGGTNACLDFGNKSWVTIDGGVPCGEDSNGNDIPESTCQGKIEATANGTGLANQQSNSGGVGAGIWAPGTSNIEIKNLDVRNVYIHTSSSDTVPIGSNGNAGISTNGTESNWRIHDSKFHDVLWALNFNSCSAAMTNIEIDHNDFYRTDHAIAIGIGNQTDTGILIHHNHIHDPANWDASGTPYHHDGVHHFDGACGLNGGSITSLINANRFDGDWGVSNTAHIFFEGHVYGSITNNLFRVVAGQHMSNGSINNCNNPDPTLRYVHFYNNTIISLDTNPSAPIELCGNADVRNNAETQAETNNTQLASYRKSGSQTWDNNVYGNDSPGSNLFTNTGSCCTLSYSAWKSLFGFDAHSSAILPTAIGLNTTTGVPSAGSPVIGAGTNLTSMGIAALDVDKNGVARGAAGNWDAGAYKYGAGVNTPIANISPTPVAFGNQNVSSTSSSITVTISNVGSSALILANPTYYSLSGGNSGDFAVTAITCSPALSIAPSSSCTIGITFTPSAAGSRSTTLMISSNATAATASLTGTGIATAGSLSFSPASPETFGTVTVGGNNSQTITVSNIGTATVTMTTPHYTISGTNASEFSRTGGTCADGGTIAAGANCTITIKFLPTTAGSKTATLQINAGAATASVSLTATGAAVVITPPAPMVQIL